MQVLMSYRDLCKEIEVLELRAECLEEESKILRRKINPMPIMKLTANYSGMPVVGMSYTPIDKLWHRLAEIQSELSDIYDILELKTDYKMRMESRMNEFEGLEYKVAYMRDIERKPLSQIAKELKYSYEWIRKVSARVKRMRTPA